MTVGSSSRNGAKVRLLAVHTTEGVRTCPDLLAFFEREYKDNPDTAGSSHAGACDTCQSEFLSYDRAAWTLRSGNLVSDNIELCGMAAWSRAEWLRHMTMLDGAAQWLAKRAKARGIPLVKLTPADVAAGRSGVIGHADWTTGMHDGSHWDPGPSFPWDLLMPLANRYLTPPPIEKDWLDMATQQDVIAAVTAALRSEGVSGAGDATVMLDRGYRQALTEVKGIPAGLDLDALANAVADKLAARLSG